MEKTQQELCKEEIEAVMAKYPTCVLNVQHTIQVQEIAPLIPTEVIEKEMTPDIETKE